MFYRTVLFAPASPSACRGYSRSRALGFRNALSRAPPPRASARFSTRGVMDPDIVKVVQDIHASPLQLVVYTTGGASQAASWLLTVPGASRTVLEARVPYSVSALVDALGDVPPPTSAASAASAESLATAAYRRAAALSSPGVPVLGVGAACALTTDRLRRGADRVHVAVSNGVAFGSFSAELSMVADATGRLGPGPKTTGTDVTSLTGSSGVAGPSSGELEETTRRPVSPGRSRAEQEDLASRIVLDAIHAAILVEDSQTSGLTRTGANLSNSGAESRPSGLADAGSVARISNLNGPVTRLSIQGTPAGISQLSLQGFFRLHPGDSVARVELPLAASSPGALSAALEALLSGAAALVEVSGGRVFVDAPRPGGVYLPGSFNPLHEGHEKLLLAARDVLIRHRQESVRSPEDISGDPTTASHSTDHPSSIIPFAAFELSVKNADKGLLDRDVVERRVEQFIQRDLPLVITREPLFAGKANVLRAPAFAVGYDTAKRILDAKYYGGDPLRALAELSRLGATGASFLTAGRLDADSGRFFTLADLQLPVALAEQDLFLEVPAFRSDISSTELRARGEGLR